MGHVFLEITVIICLAALVSLVFRLLKQPEILAYILTGIIIGPLGLFHPSDPEFLRTMGEVGITLLLFMIGLEIRVTDLSAIGKIAFIAGGAQILFSFAVGYILALIFGFPMIASLYISLAFTFSSTVTIVKILSDKKELHSLYGKISIGILLMQDFFAILFLIFLSGFNTETGSAGPLAQFGLAVGKSIVLFGIIIYLSREIFPRIVEKIAKSSETLFLVSLAWVFGLAALVSSPYIGFSIEIGGLLAGLALANSVANYQIIAKAKILRDFFIIIFFVMLGIQMSFGNIAAIILPAIAMSLFVLVGKPFIVMWIIGWMGYRKRTSFLTGLTLSQISEFSLILVFLGSKLGHISNNTVSLITLVGIITFVLSSYMVINSKKLYAIFGESLNFLEGKQVKKDEMEMGGDGLEKLKGHVILVGGDQMGQSILEVLEDMDMDVVVIDFDPGVVKKLENKKIYRLFGDISDIEIQKRAQLQHAKLVISTIPDLEDNLILLKELQYENRKAKIVALAMDSHDAKVLYKAGADYVVLPYLAGGRQIAKLLTEDTLEKIENLKTKDAEYLG